MSVNIILKIVVRVTATTRKRGMKWHHRRSVRSWVLIKMYRWPISRVSYPAAKHTCGKFHQPIGTTKITPNFYTLRSILWRDLRKSTCTKNWPQGSISPTFYAKRLRTQIPKPKRLMAWLYFLSLWDLVTKKLLV